MCIAHRGQKVVLDPLELELQVMLGTKQNKKEEEEEKKKGKELG